MKINEISSSGSIRWRQRNDRPYCWRQQNGRSTEFREMVQEYIVMGKEVLVITYRQDNDLERYRGLI